jgi:ribosome biogenesis GTPase A
MNEKIKKLKEIAFKYEELKEIQEKVQNFIKEYEDFKIPIVFIGEFSVGKSSLINKILDEDLLEVNTTPTTAKPYEICYSEEEKRYNKDGIEFLFLKNKNLKNIKNLKIVDLPGITSQYFEHTSIVENYLAN